MVSSAVDILIQGQHILRTSDHAQTTAFASLLVHYDSTSDFCHISAFFNYPSEKYTFSELPSPPETWA
jgi:hypothetical protein